MTPEPVSSVGCLAPARSRETGSGVVGLASVGWGIFGGLGCV